MKTLKYAGRFLMRSKSYQPGLLHCPDAVYPPGTDRGLALHRPATHHHPVAGHRRKHSPRKSGARLVGHGFNLYPGK